MSSSTATGPATTKWRGNRMFLGQFLEKPTMIGAIAPSSVHLARCIADQIDLKSAGAVLEYGPGTGVVTDVLLSRLSPTCRFVAIELNPELVQAFRRRHPGVRIRHDSVENVQNICSEEGIGQVDVIVSGLPFASFPDSLQRKILDAAVAVLRPGGKFVTFGYQIGTWLPAGRRFHKLLPTYFREIKRSPLVWRNLPPAFVFTGTI